MFKAICFVTIFCFVNSFDEDVRSILRQHRLLGKYGPVPLAPKEGNEDESTVDNIFAQQFSRLVQEDEKDKEVEVLHEYGDDAKNYKIGVPLPEMPKDVEAADLKCYVPTRRGMILTHCGLVDGEGFCPATQACGFLIPHFWSLPKLCLSDFDCPIEQKCCRHTCYRHKICQRAVSEVSLTTTKHINIKQYVIMNVYKDEKPDVNSTVDDVEVGRNLTENNTSGPVKSAMIDIDAELDDSDEDFVGSGDDGIDNHQNMTETLNQNFTLVP